MSGQQKRRVFFWILAVLFAATTILVVFYAVGYRFSLERGVFIFGGSITVKSNPRQVTITLDGNSVSQKKINFINNSYHIDGIRPGEYGLKVSAPGFKSWSKKVTVHSGISTEFWNVLLVRENYPWKDWHVTGSDRFFVSPDDKYIAYPQNREDELQVNLVDTNSGMYESLFKTAEYSFADGQKESMEWSPHSDAVIFPAVRKENGEKKYFLATLRDKKNINLNDLLQKNDIEEARWDPMDKNIVYFVADNNLYQLDINDATNVKTLSASVVSFDFASDKLYFLELNGLVYEIDRAGTTPARQITTSPPDDMRDNNYKIIVYDKDRIAYLRNQNPKLYLWNKGVKDSYFRELSSDFQGVQFSDDGKKLLYWNQWEIFVYFARDWDVQPTRAENEILHVTRLSQPVTNVQWSKDYEHVIFVTDNTIKIAELDRRDHCNADDVFKLENAGGSVMTYPADEKLYFSQKVSDNGFGLFSLDFPEKEGILGF